MWFVAQSAACAAAILSDRLSLSLSVCHTRERPYLFNINIVQEYTEIKKTRSYNQNFHR